MQIVCNRRMGKKRFQIWSNEKKKTKQKSTKYLFVHINIDAFTLKLRELLPVFSASHTVII